jgi:tetratricopeptide (TPR) repeat protein
MEAAELKIKTNKSAEALTDLEALLATLNPTSWLHREVRRKIDDVFLRTNNQDGLTKYYEAWVKKNPEDVDAMARLGRLLAKQARVPEAQAWLDKALKLAPKRKELRLAFIEQLVDDQRFADAIAQYELLDKAEPNNPDFLREWGKLVLRDTSKPKDQRFPIAEKIWRRLLVARANDPLIAVQVADLFRHAEMPGPALELYKKAVELAPNEPQYREYLGEFYHQQKRTAEALATWREIAAGNKRTAATASRLAEVLSTFGYLAEAIPEIQAARQLDPKDFTLHLKGADLLIKAEKYTEKSWCRTPKRLSLSPPARSKCSSLTDHSPIGQQS